MGDRTIQQVPFRFIAVLWAPFILAGCGAPLAVQVASLFADGISLVTTDKTLTDHGLSAIAGKDCAVWRGVKGEEICLDENEDALVVAETDASHPPTTPEEDEKNIVFSDSYFPAGDDEKPAEPLQPKNDIARIGWEDPDEQPVKTAPFSPVVTSTPLLPPPSPIVTSSVDEPPSEPEIQAPTEILGGTFYVIASFRGRAAAQRYSNKQARWKAQVFEGTASGRTVFRVAIGPVGKKEMRITHGKLIESGFKDAWALKINQPRAALELAGLN